jgi:hypothetical protein
MNINQIERSEKPLQGLGNNQPQKFDMAMLEEMPLDVINFIANKKMQEAVNSKFMMIERRLKEQSEEFKEVIDTVAQQRNIFDEEIGKLVNQNHMLHEKMYYNNSDGWLNLSDLGDRNNPSLSNSQMSRILRGVGLLKPNKNSENRYLPYHHFYNGSAPLVKKSIREITCTDHYGVEFAKRIEEHKYHNVRTWSFIINKFKEKGILSEFRNCMTKNDVAKFMCKHFSYSTAFVNKN